MSFEVNIKSGASMRMRCSLMDRVSVVSESSNKRMSSSTLFLGKITRMSISETFSSETEDQASRWPSIATHSSLPLLICSKAPFKYWRTSCWRSEEHTSELQSQSNLVCR